VSVVIAVLASAVLGAQAGSLEAAAQAFDAAQQNHDRETISRFLAPDFQYVTRKGLLLGRDAFITNTTDPKETLEPFVVSDHRVLQLGPDAGIASGDSIVRGTLDGKPFADRFRYADVFARRNGLWVVVYTQVTALPAPTISSVLSSPIEPIRGHKRS
jgi:ketosteroid isomerase-like protein